METVYHGYSPKPKYIDIKEARKQAIIAVNKAKKQGGMAYIQAKKELAEIDKERAIRIRRGIKC